MAKALQAELTVIDQAIQELKGRRSDILNALAGEAAKVINSTRQGNVIEFPNVHQGITIAPYGVVKNLWS